jgi:hypothetical protein
LPITSESASNVDHGIGSGILNLVEHELSLGLCTPRYGSAQALIQAAGRPNEIASVFYKAVPSECPLCLELREFSRGGHPEPRALREVDMRKKNSSTSASGA